MPWTAGAIGTPAGLPGGIAHAEVDPAWQPWLDLLEISLEEPGDAWRTALRVDADRAAGAPLLDGALVNIDGQRAGALVQRLAQAAGLVTDGCDAPAMIRAALARDEETLLGMADDSDVPIDAFAVVAHAAAIPLLHTAATLLDANAATAWQRSYCPVCGARPSLAEARGIERDRRLRCGACSADWPLAMLHCAFCDELDHKKLGSLSVDGEGQLRYIETCESCRGYLKAVKTFDALTFRSLMLLDLSTIPLDLIAHERGYARPARPGWAPHVELAAWPERGTMP